MYIFKVITTKQYPMLKFVWNKSENILTAVGTKYEESYNGNITLTEKGRRWRMHASS